MAREQKREQAKQLPTATAPEQSQSPTGGQPPQPQVQPTPAPFSIATALASPGESFLNALYNGMTEAVLAVQVTTRQIVYWNITAEALFGYTQEEVLGQTTRHLYIDEVAFQHLYDRSTPDIHTHGYWHGEAEFKRRDGSQFLGEVTFSTFLQTSREDAYAVVVLRDITEQKQLETQMRERERLAALGVVLAKVAHEIGNPLNGMVTTLQILERHLTRHSLPADDPAVEATADLKQETNRLQSLLQELRAFASPPKLTPQPTNVADIVTAVLQGQSAYYGTRQVVVQPELPPELPLVMADPGKLTQVLLNLCSNAVEAMPAGGTLLVRATYDPTFVYLEVHDTGAGIPPDLDIFSPFVTTKTQGSGLGLAIVKQIVDAHGGTITYHSIGQGTTFRVALPVCPSALDEKA